MVRGDILIENRKLFFFKLYSSDFVVVVAVVFCCIEFANRAYCFAFHLFFVVVVIVVHIEIGEKKSSSQNL